jgi:hypothetical protein
LRCDAREEGFGEGRVGGCEVGVGAGLEGGFDEGREVFGEEVLVGWGGCEEDVGYAVESKGDC